MIAVSSNPYSPSWLRESCVPLERLLPQGKCNFIHVPSYSNDAKPLNESESQEPEIEFAKENIANDASIYARPFGRTPRSFLWRILGHRVLHILTFDMTLQSAVPNGNTLKIQFPARILPFSVGFGESQDTDVVIIYILTEANLLYSINLTSNELLSCELKDRKWCSVYSPSSFEIRPPHFMKVVDVDSVLFAFQDGGLLKLERDESFDWFETIYSDSGYLSSLKHIIPWSGSPRGNRNYPSNLVVSLVISKKLSLIFSISVDLKLKIWSLSRNQLLKVYDMSTERSGCSPLIDSTPRNLISLFETRQSHDTHFHLVTFNPQGEGSFGVWEGNLGPSGQTVDLRDVLAESGLKLQAYIPSTDSIWIVIDFVCDLQMPASRTGQSLELWILWKSNTSSVTQTTSINLKDPKLHWISAFPAVGANPSKVIGGPSVATSEDVSEFWICQILSSQYPSSVLRTALQIYQQNQYPQDTIPLKSPQSLEQKIRKVITQSVKQQIDPVDGSVQYRSDINVAWHRFSRLCSELDRRAHEPFSLCRDSGQILIIKAGRVSVIRGCLGAELLTLNSDDLRPNLEKIAKLPIPVFSPIYRIIRDQSSLVGISRIAVASNILRNNLTRQVLDDVRSTLHEEVIRTPTFTIEDRLWMIYDSCLYENITESTHGALREILNNCNQEKSLEELLVCIVEHEQVDSHSGNWAYTLLSLLCSGIVDLVLSRRDALLNAILLIAYIVNTDEHSSEDIQYIAVKYLKSYKTFSLLSQVAMYRPGIAQENSSTDMILSHRLENMHILNTLKSPNGWTESTFMHQILDNLTKPSFPNADSTCFSKLINSTLTQLGIYKNASVFPLKLLNMLRQARIEDANRFLEWLPQCYWGMYIKGRIYLELGEYSKAEWSFSKASVGLASEEAMQLEEGLALRENLEDNVSSNVGKGPSRYFLHIASLFELKSLHKSVVRTCKLALQTNFTTSKASSLDSDIWAKLFRSAILCGLYDEAYLSLQHFESRKLQIEACRQLIVKMCQDNQSVQLFQYPFVGLQDDVDEILQSKAESVVETNGHPNYHRLLYSWRVMKSNYRGAASIMYERIKQLQNSTTGTHGYMMNSLEITESYLALISVLSCLKKDDAWIVASFVETESHTAKKPKFSHKLQYNIRRKLLTLEDLRQEYNAELARMRAMLSGPLG